MPAEEALAGLPAAASGANDHQLVLPPERDMQQSFDLQPCVVVEAAGWGGRPAVDGEGGGGAAAALESHTAAAAFRVLGLLGFAVPVRAATRGFHAMEKVDEEKLVAGLWSTAGYIAEDGQNQRRS